MIKGDFVINDQILNQRDALGIWDFESIDIIANTQDAEILILDVPMSV